jgi:MFS transporter, DHA1 family, tetracycline resistance protein
MAGGDCGATQGTRRSQSKLRLSTAGSDTSSYTGLLVTLYLPAFAMSTGQGMVAPMIPAFMTEFGVSAGVAAQVISALSAGRVLSLALSGTAVDRFGSRWTMLVGAGIVVLGTAAALILYPFAQSYLQLALVTVIVGAGGGLALASMTISTYDIAPPGLRGIMQSIRRGVGELGSLVGPVLAGAIIDRSSSTVAFHVFAPVFVLVAYLAIVVARETHPLKQPAATQTPQT